MSAAGNLISDFLFLSRTMARPKSKKGLYLAYMGTRNLGDEALREAILSMFGRRIVWSREKGKMLRVAEKLGLLRFDIAMLGGGTLIFDADGSLRQMLNDDSPLKVVFGTGATDFEFRDEKSGSGSENGMEWLAFINRADYVGVRGPLSKKILLDRGCKRAIEIIGDPVLYFTRDIIAKKEKQKKIGLNIGTAKKRNRADLVWGGSEATFYNEFSKFVERLASDGWSVEFVPVCAEDVPVIERLIDKTGLTRKVPIFKGFDSTESTLNKLEEFDLFVGEKLHSVVLSYCSHTPAMMIEYRPKCRDFMESIEMDEFIIRTDQFNAQAAIDMVGQLNSNLEKFRKKAASNCLRYKSLLKARAAELLFKLGSQS